MIDRLKEIWTKIKDWWNRFQSKQKTIIIVVVASIAIAMAIMIALLGRTQYEPLTVVSTTKEAATITDLLKSSNIDYIVSDDGYDIKVARNQLSEANLLLGANDIPTAAYDISNVVKGGFSTTESDKQKMYKLYLEKQMETDLARFESVASADVQLSLPENDGTLIAKNEEAFASIILELEGEFTDDNAKAMAQFIKTALGNETASNVVIIDTNGNLLFSGDDETTKTGSPGNQLSIKTQTESTIQSNVKKVLLGTNEYDYVEVSSNLKLDFSHSEIVDHQYTPAEDQTQGVLSHENSYNAESTGGEAGAPGTDSNVEDQPTYVFENGALQSSTVTEESKDYLPNEKIIQTTIPAGLVIYGESSISVAAIKYDIVKEDIAKAQGLLDGTNWEEYKASNSDRTKLTVEEEYIDMISKASGIPPANISVVAYQEPMFVDSDGSGIGITDIAQILLIVLILALLGYVIYRSTRREKVEEEEQELSVESLLESTATIGLEDIGVESKSETRKLIDKFVDENPEAAANLLRNWLNEDWG